MPKGTLQDRQKKRLEEYRAKRAEPKKKRGRPAKKALPEVGGDKPNAPKNPPRATDTSLPRTILGIDTSKFLRLIKKRTNDPLHILVDMAQATSALRMFSVLEKCDTVDVFALEPDEKVKLLNAIKGANGSANDTLKSLQITANTREDVDLSDKALERLAAEDILMNLPPSLQSEFLRATEDMNKISGDVDEQTQTEQQALVDEIRKPVDVNSHKEEAEREAITTIDVDEVGVGGLS